MPQPLTQPEPAAVKLGWWVRFKGTWRARREADPDPRKAPHFPLVVAILRAHLPPLEVRLRGDMIEELAARLVALEPSPVPLIEESRAAQIVLLAMRTQLAIDALESDQRQAQRRFANFSNLYSQMESDDERLRLMEDFLAETAAGRTALRRDIAALRRYMGIDALRERNAGAAARLGILIELALRFLEQGLTLAAGRPEIASPTHRAGFGTEQLDRPREPIDPDAAAVINTVREGNLVPFLAERMRTADRWQTRLAAADAMGAMLRITGVDPAAIVPVADPATTAADSDRPAPTRRDPTPAELAETAACNLDEHPWVQTAALDVVLLHDRVRGQAILRQRLFEISPDAPPSDFLARSRMLRLATVHLAQRELDALLAEVVEKRDRSEHVRVRLCDLVQACSFETAARLLRRLAGLDTGSDAPDGADPAEPSYRVRASACIAARRLAIAALEEGSSQDAAFVDVIASTIERETNTMVIEIVAQEIVEIVTRYRQKGALPRIENHVAGWLRLLLGIGENPASKPRMAESSSSAAEAIDRELDENRQNITAALYRLATDIRPGESKQIPLTSLEPQLREALENPDFIGRILADLTRRDWGLSIETNKRALLIWRGDHFKRRAWRVIHEFKNRAPNKRQAFLHTIGRVERGHVRAHPGGLDEVTATTVPGERVFNDAEGSWGRHLPTVDDILDLPLRSRDPVKLYSSYGVTTLTSAQTFWQRLKNRARVTWRYRKLDDLRRASLSSTEPRDRRRFLQAVHDDMGVEATFSPYPYARLPDTRPAPPAALTNLFPEPAPPAAEIAATASLGAFLPWDDISEFFSVHSYYFLSPSENSQIALAIFGGGLVTWYVANAFLKRASLVRAREQVPLCIGGWGTRGKSGTERIKAALFHGLGYEIFVKTTGCEAMLIHSAPGQAPTEIFIYRPYDKATIWEQADMLHLGRRLDCDVFLWECMALNPRYVELLAHEWMRDDVNTLTNAYPDHEDIQGPAGINVAEVIASYIPYKGRLLHSELNFQPLFREVAKQRDAVTTVVGEREGNLIADDMLDLYPYREHPRNIALSTQLAGEFGIDPELAQATMAEHVVPDLGVLKVYPPVRVRGRRIGFINGCSANERTGFIACWRRMGLDDVSVEKTPGEMIVIVVNNRADRIARSEVFSRILARDVATDRFVLIGTNLKGLWGFTETAIDSYLSEQVVVDAEDLKDRGNRLPLERLARHMLKLRIPDPDPEALLRRFRTWAEGAGYALADKGAARLQEAVAAYLESMCADRMTDFATALARAQSDPRIESALVEALQRAEPKKQTFAELDFEVLDPATKEDFGVHLRRQLARSGVRAGLQTILTEVLDRGDLAGAAPFTERFKAAYRQMFLESIIVVDDSSTSGDRIIQICATSVPPGTRVQLMGCQNIKGTGLDFVYRWLAIERITVDLKNLDSPRLDKRMAALLDIESFEDHGVYDTGLAREALALPPTRAPTPDEAAARERARKKADDIHNKKRAALTSVAKKDNLDRAAGFVEGWIDYLDSVRRRKIAKKIQDELVAQRISHGRAALEMRKLVGRMKGGWLAKALRRKKPA